MISIDKFLNHIFPVNCLRYLKRIESNSVDLILTDPPYAISKKGKKGIQRKHTTTIKQDFGRWDQFESEEKFVEITEQWFKECVRILKPGAWIVICFDSLKTGIFSLNLAPKYMVKTRTIFTWCKSNPPPSYRKVNWISSSEHIWIGTKAVVEKSGDLRYPKIPNFLNQTEMKNWLVTPCKSNYGETNHPTEKPRELFSLFVRALTNEGDIVLDPFGGSGTTAVVCRELKRQYVLFERNYKYCNMAIRRVYDTVESTQEEGDMLVI